MTDRVIFHVDVNSAFVSWSSLKLLMEGSTVDYRMVPSIAAKNMDRRGSIVTSKSVSAKKYGIVTGEPTSFAIRKCPGLVVLPLDFDWYRNCSSRMMSVCRAYSEVVQPFSIDECFIDMSDFDYSVHSKLEVAYQLKNQIKSELGFTVNVGVGPNKLLAKMASDMDGPDKVHYLHKDNLEFFLWDLDVQKLFFCGPKSADKLRTNGILTIGDLAKSHIERIQEIVGEKFGTVLWQYANGIDDSPVVTEVRKRKSLSHAHTLEYDAMTLNDVLKALRNLCDDVCLRLRNENTRCRLVYVSLRSNMFVTWSKQRKVSNWISSSDDIYAVAAKLVEEIYQSGVPIRQVGVGVGSFECNVD
jgi:DNA polymerase-4